MQRTNIKFDFLSSKQISHVSDSLDHTHEYLYWKDHHKYAWITTISKTERQSKYKSKKNIEAKTKNNNISHNHYHLQEVIYDNWINAKDKKKKKLLWLS